MYYEKTFFEYHREVSCIVSNFMRKKSNLKFVNVFKCKNAQKIKVCSFQVLSVKERMINKSIFDFD